MEQEPNLSNSCFMLSVLRCLFNTKKLTEKLEEISEDLNKNTSGYFAYERRVITRYINLLKSVENNKNVNNSWKIFRTLDQITEDFYLGEYNDPSLFFNFLINSFGLKNQDINIFSSLLCRHSVNDFNCKEWAKLIKDADENDNNEECIKILINYVSNRIEHDVFNFNYLELQSKNDCLDETIKKNFDEYILKNKKEKVKFIKNVKDEEVLFTIPIKFKQFISVVLPDVLCIKSCYDRNNVPFSDNIKFSCVKNENLDSKSLTYENIDEKFKNLHKKEFHYLLRSFVMYSGDHYISFCKDYKSEKYMKYDEISKLEQGKEMEASQIDKIMKEGHYDDSYTPYLLFYEKIQEKEEKKESSFSLIEQLKQSLLKRVIKMKILAAKIKNLFCKPPSN
jgi:hypothetical protein